MGPISQPSLIQKSAYAEMKGANLDKSLHSNLVSVHELTMDLGAASTWLESDLEQAITLEEERAAMEAELSSKDQIAVATWMEENDELVKRLVHDKADANLTKTKASLEL